MTDPHERIVRTIIKWVLTGCDINKDITVTDMLQLSAINIQLKDADRVFRVWIKSLGDKAVYKVEESLKIRSRLTDALQTIRRLSYRCILMNLFGAMSLVATSCNSITV